MLFLVRQSDRYLNGTKPRSDSVVRRLRLEIERGRAFSEAAPKETTATAKKDDRKTTAEIIISHLNLESHQLQRIRD